MLGKKKMCLIVRSEETFGISLWVNEDFDEDTEVDPKSRTVFLMS